MARLDERPLYTPPDRLHPCPYDILSNFTKRKVAVPGAAGHWPKKRQTSAKPATLVAAPPPPPRGRIEVTRMPSEYGLEDGDFELTVIDLGPGSFMRDPCIESVVLHLKDRDHIVDAAHLRKICNKIDMNRVVRKIESSIYCVLNKENISLVPTEDILR